MRVDEPSRLRRIERRVDDVLREIAGSAEREDLPGRGAPLRDDDPRADDGWAARHVMRQAQAVPEWVDLRREIDERTAQIARRLRAHREWLHDRTRYLGLLSAERILEASRATERRDAKVRAELERAVGDVNALIRRYDLMVIPALQLPLVSLERLDTEHRS